MSNEIIKKAFVTLKSAGIDALDNKYVAVDNELTSLFLNDRGLIEGETVREKTLEALELSLPLSRAIGSTYPDIGTQHWHERGLEFSWSYEKSHGLHLSVLVSKQ